MSWSICMVGSREALLAKLPAKFDAAAKGQGEAHEKVILSIKDQVLAMLEKATAWDAPGKEYVFNVETSGHFDSSYGNSTLKIGQVELARA